MTLFKLVVQTHTQTMLVYENDVLRCEYQISTAKKGLGERRGSEQTPRGWHKIRAKIGTGCPIYSVFIARRPTGQIYSPDLQLAFPGRDWILSRILWLSGLEIAKNRLGEVDTMRRYIYIHGTSDEHSIGIPSSHGCIRMSNQDILELYSFIPVATRVLII